MTCKVNVAYQDLNSNGHLFFLSITIYWHLLYVTGIQVNKIGMTFDQIHLYLLENTNIYLHDDKHAIRAWTLGGRELGRVKESFPEELMSMMRLKDEQKSSKK